MVMDVVVALVLRELPLPAVDWAGLCLGHGRRFSHSRHCCTSRVGGLACFYFLGVLLIGCCLFRSCPLLSKTVGDPSAWSGLGHGFVSGRRFAAWCMAMTCLPVSD